MKSHSVHRLSRRSNEPGTEMQMVTRDCSPINFVARPSSIWPAKSKGLIKPSEKARVLV